MTTTEKNWISSLTLLGLMWLAFAASYLTPLIGIHLEQYGVVPRTAQGLTGILTMPLLHQNLAHILGNSMALLSLCAILNSLHSKAWLPLTSIWIGSGALTWLIARNAVHIGASGIIYGLAAYLMLIGFLEKKWITATVGTLVGVFYGVSFLSGAGPWTNPNVSWEAHVAGALSGILTAFLQTYITKQLAPKTPDAQKEPEPAAEQLPTP
jgi:membrane associated rhomboid family serine protease